MSVLPLVANDQILDFIPKLSTFTKQSSVIISYLQTPFFLTSFLHTQPPYWHTMACHTKWTALAIRLAGDTQELMRLVFHLPSPLIMTPSRTILSLCVSVTLAHKSAFMYAQHTPKQKKPTNTQTNFPSTPLTKPQQHLHTITKQQKPTH